MNTLNDYHAHLYFEFTDIGKAEGLVEKIKKAFECPIGRIWDKPVGPHPIGSCQISVSNDLFPQIIPWLMKERGKMDVFVHANTGNDFLDHTQYVMWLGKSHNLNIDIFRK